jgi:PhnB protein
MRVDTYLTFDGNCAEAFELYARCFGGRLGPMFLYAESPMGAQVPPHWGDKVMHGSVELPDRILMGADAVPGTYETPSGFSLSIQVARVEDAERVWAALCEGGEERMPLQETFWAERFGMCVDRFGIPWQVNCEGANAGSETASDQLS